NSECRSLVGSLILAASEPVYKVPLLGDLCANGIVRPITAAQEDSVNKILRSSVKQLKTAKQVGSASANQRQGSNASVVVKPVYKPVPSVRPVGVLSTLMHPAS